MKNNRKGSTRQKNKKSNSSSKNDTKETVSEIGHWWSRIRVVIVNSSQAMRELVMNSAGASQFVGQNDPDLPQQNRDQKSCNLQGSFTLPSSEWLYSIYRLMTL